MICSIKPGISIPDFLKALDACQGDIVYQSKQGDCLDMKSQLCKYLFLSIAADLPEGAMQGTISCRQTDYFLLKDYLVSCN